MEKIRAYLIHLEPAEEGGYTVTVPSLPGCITEGETFEEAVAMAQDCIKGYLEALAKDGRPIPEDPQPSGAVDLRVEVAIPAHI